MTIRQCLEKFIQNAFWFSEGNPLQQQKTIRFIKDNKPFEA